MQPIVARPRPILVSSGLASAGPILAARFIVSPAFARLRFAGLTLEANQSCTLDIAYHPREAGGSQAELVVDQGAAGSAVER